MADRWAMTDADTLALCGVSGEWLLERVRAVHRFHASDMVGVDLPDGRKAWCGERPYGWVCDAVAPAGDVWWHGCYRLDNAAFWNDRPMPDDYQTFFRVAGRRLNLQRLRAGELVSPEGALIVAYGKSGEASLWQVVALNPAGYVAHVRNAPDAQPQRISEVENAEGGWSPTQGLRFEAGRLRLWKDGQVRFANHAMMQGAAHRAENAPKIAKAKAQMAPLGSKYDKYPAWDKLVAAYGEAERKNRYGCKRTMAHVGGWKAARRGETLAAVPFSSKFSNLAKAWRAGWEEGRESLEVIEAIGE